MNPLIIIPVVVLIALALGANALITMRRNRRLEAEIARRQTEFATQAEAQSIADAAAAARADQTKAQSDEQRIAQIIAEELALFEQHQEEKGFTYAPSQRMRRLMHAVRVRMMREGVRTPTDLAQRLAA